MKQSIEERFWSKVDTSGDCWLWTGGRDNKGYGKFRFAGRQDNAHRVSWILANGPIGGRLVVCHRCDNPQCVRPDHLFLGTYRANILDSMHKGRFIFLTDEAREKALQVRAANRSERRAVPSTGFNQKLTPVQVEEIRVLATDGQSLYVDIARRFEISPSTVRAIVDRRIWRDVA